MFIKIELKNFRKHTDLVVDFTNGLQVIRAANEGGKTTLIEAALYALYGSTALRESLEETVTWGFESKTLKVVLTIRDSSGQTYVFSRSKGGAEVSRDGQVFVTGQKDVSAFGAIVMGADAKVAGQLMMSGQGGLRGVLEEGPKATAQTIENLANFELFDKILDAAAERLVTGSTAQLAARSKLLSEQLASTENVSAVDESAVLSERASIMETVSSLNDRITTTLQPMATSVTETWRNLHDVRERAEGLRRELAQVEATAEATKADIARVSPDASEVLPDLEHFEAELAAAKAHAEVVSNFSKFDAILKVKKPVDRKAWLVEVEELKRTLAESRNKVASANGDIRVLRAQKITETACGLCGKDLSEVPEVVAKNAQKDAEIAALEALVATLTAQITEGEATLAVVKKTEDADQAIQRAAVALSNCVSTDLTVIPATVAWAGPAVSSEAPDLARISSDLENAKHSHKRILAAIAQLDAYQSTFVAVNSRAEALKKQIQDLAPVSDDYFNAFEEKHLRSQAELRAATDAVAESLRSVEEIDSGISQRRVAAEAVKAQREMVLAQIAQAEADIVNVEFNNVLIKKVRAARPIIANKLWNSVLTSVSQLFTRMRGEQSVVTRGEDGFLVNGKGIGGLSGSTLDILGLAVRTALIRTFLPNCSLLVLDEPYAACDNHRTTALLGFIASAGFDQTILITHEEVSESFASNLISL